MNKYNLTRGILHIVCAAACFALMSYFVRLSGDVPFLQKCFFRNIVALVVAFVLLLRTEDKFRIQKGCLPFLLLRAGFGFIGLISNFYAIDHMNIADANMLNKLSPFAAIVFSVFILKERPGKHEWAAVLIAFAGALFVMKPTFDWSVLPAAVGLLGGICAGVAYTFVRLMGKKGERGPMIVFVFSLTSTLLTLPAIVFNYQPMTMQQFLCLVAAGMCGMGGQLNITAAYTFAPAREISVYDYTQILFAAVLGMLFLGQFPDALSIVGYVLIIGAGVFCWLWNKRKKPA